MKEFIATSSSEQQKIANYLLDPTLTLEELGIELQQTEFLSVPMCTLTAWSYGQAPLYTLGAAVCVAPVLIGPKNAVTGLFHYPFTFELVDFYKRGRRDMTGAFSGVIDDIKEKIISCPGEWKMLLFGCGADPIRRDSSVTVEDQIKNKTTLLDFFTEMGFECYDQTSKDPYAFLDALVVDPKIKKIRYLYSRNH